MKTLIGIIGWNSFTKIERLKNMKPEEGNTGVERIKKEAQDAADNFDIRGCAAHQGFLRGHIAGATAERKRAEELRQSLSEFTVIGEEIVNEANRPGCNYSISSHWYIRIKSAIERAKRLTDEK